MSGATPLERLACGESAFASEPAGGWAPELYWLWLTDLLRPGFAHTGRVLDEYGSARTVWEQRFDVERFAHAAGAAAARRLAKEEKTPGDFEPVRAACNACGAQIVCYDAPEYPLALSRISDLPFVLYCTGDARWLNAAHTVGVVGSRRPTAYGVEAAARLGGQLAQGGAVIVSGMADGLDSEGHKAAVKNQRPTIAVLGVPIDCTYPASNAGLRRNIEACGVVVSEYPPVGNEFYRAAFLQRNRIIAALSDALLVVEARQRSGTMSTVGHAVRYGKPVFAVPGSIFSPLSEGVNELLRTGRARPAVRAEDILQTVGLHSTAPQPAAAKNPQPSAGAAKSLSPDAQKVLACLGPVPVGLSALAGRTGLSMGALLGALTALEVAGRITALPGRQYILK